MVYELILDIMNPEVETDDIDVRDVIHLAEDTDFTIEQSKIVSPWLLDYALEYRDSFDLDDASSVYSAIRTGASMLYRDSIENLFLLLGEGHKIDTVKVTVKMIERIFEAQPPAKIGDYETVAQRLCYIAKSTLSYHTGELAGEPGALAQLCITALAAMGSESVYQMLEIIKNQETWFKNYVLHNLKEIRTNRQERAIATSVDMADFLNEVIEFWENIINE